jgi:hypothetical protein
LIIPVDAAIKKMKAQDKEAVRDSVNGKVIVADGYHRLCAVYSYNEDAVIPCKIA